MDCPYSGNRASRIYIQRVTGLPVSLSHRVDAYLQEAAGMKGQQRPAVLFAASKVADFAVSVANGEGRRGIGRTRSTGRKETSASFRTPPEITRASRSRIFSHNFAGTDRAFGVYLLLGNELFTARRSIDFYSLRIVKIGAIYGTEFREIRQTGASKPPETTTSVPRPIRHSETWNAVRETTRLTEQKNDLTGEERNGETLSATRFRRARYKTLLRLAALNSRLSLRASRVFGGLYDDRMRNKHFATRRPGVKEPASESRRRAGVFKSRPLRTRANAPCTFSAPLAGFLFTLCGTRRRNFSRRGAARHGDSTDAACLSRRVC